MTEKKYIYSPEINPTFSAPKVKDKNGKEISVTLDVATQYAIQKARQDPLLFMRLLFGHKPASHHKEWVDAMISPDINRLLIVSSRSFGKTMTTLGFAAWWLGNNPLSTNVIASVSKEQATKRITNLKEIVQYNKTYQTIFPWIKPDPQRPWVSTEFSIIDNRMSYAEYKKKRNAIGNNNSASFMVTSIGGSGLIGARLSGISIVDDPHDETAAYSPTARERAIEWFYRTFINCIMPSGKAIIITTRWHEEDLAGDIIKNKSSVYKIIESPSEKIIDGKRTSMWPELFPLNRLDEIKNGIGERMYRALYLNDVNALSGNIFQIDWLNNQLPSHLPPMERIIISVDPAFTIKKSSDYTAIALMARDSEKNIYLLNYWNIKVNPDEMNNYIETIYNETIQNYGACHKIIVENVGAQIVLIDKMIKETKLPIEPVSFKGDKRTKANALEVVCSRNKFFFDCQDEKKASILRSQFLGFPNNSKNDDIVDAIAQGVNYLIEKRGAVKAEYKPIKNSFML